MKKWFKRLIGLGLVVAAAVLGWWGLRDWDKDIRLIVLGEKELGLVSISPKRRMINLIRIGEEVNVWIPGGMGWYRTGSLRKIYQQEKNEELIKKLAFYNFGFLSQKIILPEKVDDWVNDRMLIGTLGWREWCRYRILSGKMLFGEEELTGEKINENELDDLVLRDLADSSLVNEETRLTVINVSDDIGLASFIGRRLEWAGLTVVDIGQEDENIGRCRLISNQETSSCAGYLTIIKLWDCEMVSDETLPLGEMELYLDDKLAEMLKYSQTYVGTF